MGPLMLLDSASLYFRAFYGVPETLTAPDGTPVNAVRGLLDMIARLVRARHPGRLVACLDADWRPAFRVAAIPSYTAHRALPAGSERVVTLIDLIAVASELDLATAVFRRDAVIAAGMFDEGIRERFDVDLYLRLAWRRHGIVCCAAPRGATLAAAHAAGDGRVRDLEAVASVLERFAHRHPLDATTRTALRVRIMTLIDRLEIEQAKCRMAEGHADAARFHLASARWPSWRVRLAIALLRLMPRFATTLYQHLPGATSLL